MSIDSTDERSDRDDRPDVPARVLRERSQKIREASGEVTIESQLVCFLYVLMRDHLSTGVVAQICEGISGPGGYKFSNGWLARYAEYVAKELSS